MSMNFPPEADPEREERTERSVDSAGTDSSGFEMYAEPAGAPGEPGAGDLSDEDPPAELQEMPEAASGEITDISQLPPEAQGETNGGPLGCCLGNCVGILIAVALALVARLYPAALNGFLISNLRLLMTCGGLLGIFIFGYLGWKIGRQLYKEYDAPLVKDRRRKKKRPAVKSS